MKKKSKKEQNNNKNNIAYNTNKNDFKNKIVIYKRQKTFRINEINPKRKEKKKTISEEEFNHKRSSNIKRVISSKTINEQNNESKKGVRLLKFNKKKSLLNNNETKKGKDQNHNNRNNNDRPLSIAHTPKHLDKKKEDEIEQTNETNKINKKTRKNNLNDVIKMNNNYKNKKRDSKYSEDNIYNKNKKNKEKINKNDNLNINSKNFKEQSPELQNNHKNSMPKNNNNKKSEIYSQGNINQSTNPVSLQNKQKEGKKNIIKNISKKNNNNIIINPDKNTENMGYSRNNKNKKNSFKSYNSIKSNNGNESENSKYINKSANITVNYNKKNENNFKLLSHRPFKKDNKLIIGKFFQNSSVDKKNDKNSNETSSNPKNLKYSDSSKRSKHHEKKPKIKTFKLTRNYLKDNEEKNVELSNRYTENEKTNTNNMLYNDEINKINKYNNNPIFKTMQRYHIKRIKNNSNNNNMLFINKLKLKETMKNHEKSFGQKDYFKKVNILNLNRAKSNYFMKRTAKNYEKFEMKLHHNKNKRNCKDIIFYTKHYGDHTRCPLCQSMEMKAKFSESKIGLHQRYIKPYNEDESKLCFNHSNIKSKAFPIIKSNEEKKDNNNFFIKNELSPINLNINNDLYFHSLKVQFAFNILKNKGKIEKFKINDFPVLDKYFNS